MPLARRIRKIPNTIFNISSRKRPSRTRRCKNRSRWQIRAIIRKCQVRGIPPLCTCASGSRTRQLDARGHCTVISAPMSVLARLPVVSWTSVENANMSRRPQCRWQLTLCKTRVSFDATRSLTATQIRQPCEKMCAFQKSIGRLDGPLLHIDFDIAVHDSALATFRG